MKWVSVSEPVNCPITRPPLQRILPLRVICEDASVLWCLEGDNPQTLPPGTDFTSIARTVTHGPYRCTAGSNSLGTARYKRQPAISAVVRCLRSERTFHTVPVLNRYELLAHADPGLATGGSRPGETGDRENEHGLLCYAYIRAHGADDL